MRSENKDNCSSRLNTIMKIFYSTSRITREQLEVVLSHSMHCTQRARRRGHSNSSSPSSRRATAASPVTAAGRASEVTALVRRVHRLWRLCRHRTTFTARQLRRPRRPIITIIHRWRPVQPRCSHSSIISTIRSRHQDHRPYRRNNSTRLSVLAISSSFCIRPIPRVASS